MHRFHHLRLPLLFQSLLLNVSIPSQPMNILISSASSSTIPSLIPASFPLILNILTSIPSSLLTCSCFSTCSYYHFKEGQCALAQSSHSHKQGGWLVHRCNRKRYITHDSPDWSISVCDDVSKLSSKTNSGSSALIQKKAFTELCISYQYIYISISFCLIKIGRCNFIF